MEFAKSFFQNHEKNGYLGVNEHQAMVESAVEDEEEEGSPASVSKSGKVPFSALPASMLPGGAGVDVDSVFDELGFRVEEDEVFEPGRGLTGEEENETVRLEWLAELEFSSHPSPLLLKSSGIPRSLRPQLWLHLAKPQPAYSKITARSARSHAAEIEKDLVRILPGNGCFSQLESPGIPKLRRLLKSISWLYDDIGYCQGMGTVFAHMLLVLEEEDVFRLATWLLEDVLPPNYYVEDFNGIRTNCATIGRLLGVYCPAVEALLKEHDIDIGLIVFAWLLTLFASFLNVSVLFRIWDRLFLEGDPSVLIKVVLGLIRFGEPSLLKLTNSAEIFNFLSNLPSRVTDIQALDLDRFENLTMKTIESERKAARGSRPSSHRLKKRTPIIVRSKSVSIFRNFFGGEVARAAAEEENNTKNRNVRQTELMVDLHEAILRIGRHFMSADPKFEELSLEPDFSVESHGSDHERFCHGHQGQGAKRAKALADFERRDDDELGFRKNDIIVIINSKDEHCWVGELNGLRGWFPGKFVQLLDERSKEYSPAGDDSVTEAIADLARGILCPALKRILEHGMKRPISGGHPWLFIEEVAVREVERDFKSVYSRLVLCKTYGLDEDGKVLSPEELLFRCVELVNRSHEKVQLDVKLRSLVCLGLNEQVLHLWIEILCSSTEVVNKWYEPWSFLNSPGWVGLKCECRVLAQFSFNLALDWELRPVKEDENKVEVKNSLRDMLVKHHLFSWNLE